MRAGRRSFDEDGKCTTERNHDAISSKDCQACAECYECRAEIAYRRSDPDDINSRYVLVAFAPFHFHKITVPYRDREG